MVIKSSGKEKVFLKNLNNLKMELKSQFFDHSSLISEEKQNLLFTQLQIFWLLRNENIFGLHDKFNLFISNVQKKQDKNEFFNLISLIQSNSNGKNFTFDFDDKINFLDPSFFQKIFKFLTSCENEGIVIDGYIIGLTYEYLIFNQQRSKTGSFYTPRPLAKNVCKRAIDLYLIQEMNDKFYIFNSQKSSNIEDLRNLINQEQKNYLESILNSIKIFDPSIGTGNFLVDAFVYILSLYSFFLF